MKKTHHVGWIGHHNRVLLAFNVPSNLPVWILALGCLFAIGVVKLTFGGLGITSLIPLSPGASSCSFPSAQMTIWPATALSGEVDASVPPLY